MHLKSQTRLLKGLSVEPDYPMMLSILQFVKRTVKTLQRVTGNNKTIHNIHLIVGTYVVKHQTRSVRIGGGGYICVLTIIYPRNENEISGK